MNQFIKSTTIHATAERVFDLLADPDHFNKVNPDLVITATAQSALGGYDMDWEVRFGGMTLTGESKVVKFERPRELVIDTRGGVPSRWEWALQPNGDGVHLCLTLDYTVPKALAFMGKLLEKQNEKSVEMQIANLKRMAEEVEPRRHELHEEKTRSTS